MSENKKTVEQYMNGFRTSDHAMVLDCLTDDIIWVMPGAYHHEGKAAFDKEIENENFTGSPRITISKIIEENNVVVAEGSVIGKFKTGETLNAVFCDVFEMQNGKIKKLTSYLMQL